MKPAKYCPYAIAYGLSLCFAAAQSPAVLTPGTSTESVEAIDTGTRTTFSLTGDTILSWEQLELDEGSELVYDFKSGDKVLNLLGGTKRHTIDGTVTSNGIVGFFSPNANFKIGGSINAKGVVLATLETDADEFFSKDGYSLRGGSERNSIFLSGEITATQGNVVIAGRDVLIAGSAKISASKRVLVGGGTDITISKSGAERLTVNSEDGKITNLGEVQAPQIEFKAGESTSNSGKINAGNGKVFIEVGENGQITNESSGIIISDPVFDQEMISEGVIIVPDDGDSASSVSQGTVTVPKLTRPDGSVVSDSQIVTTSAPVSASGDLSRDNVAATGSDATADRAVQAFVSVASNSRGITQATVSGVESESVQQHATSSGNRRPSAAATARQKSGSMLQRSSFFGIRGGGGGR